MSVYRRYRPLFNLIGLVLLVVLIAILKPDLRLTLNYLSRANALDIAFAVLLFIPFLATKAWRWQVILRDLKIPVPFGEALKL